MKLLPFNCFGLLGGALLFIFTAGQSRAELPPGAQHAFDKGVIAAKQQDYTLAIRFFQEARKTAPNAQELFYNLGLAESKVPGRELRAIAWFGAYLAANPNAPNEAAVKDQIHALDIKSKSNLSRLIKSVQDAANQIPSSPGDKRPDAHWMQVAILWAEAGNITAAQKAADRTKNAYMKSLSEHSITKAKAEAGDIVGAQKNAKSHNHDEDSENRAFSCIIIADAYIEAQAPTKARETIADALGWAERIGEPFEQILAEENIAEVQMRLGDTGDAAKTADIILHHDQLKNEWAAGIVKALKKAGLTISPSSTEAAVSVSDWIEKLDDAQPGPCSLNTTMFQDLAGSLGTVSSDDPHELFKLLQDRADTILRAQRVIDQMLRQQAEQQANP